MIDVVCSCSSVSQEQRERQQLSQVDHQRPRAVLPPAESCGALLKSESVANECVAQLLSHPLARDEQKVALVRAR